MSKYLNEVETSSNLPRRNQEDKDAEVDAISEIFKNIDRELGSK